MAAVLAAEGASAAAGTAQVSLEALVAMFTSMPRSCVEDIYQQCGSDGAKALEVLLGMGQECSPCSTHFTGCQDLAFPSFETTFGWDLNQDSQTATCWTSSEFGTPDHLNPLAGHVNGCNGSMVADRPWPPWDACQAPPAPNFTPCGQATVHSLASVALAQEVPSVEGWLDGLAAQHTPDFCTRSATANPAPTPVRLDGSPGVNISSGSPAVSDKDVMEFLPYLAPMLSSPSPSGTSSPARTTGAPAVAGTVALSLLTKEPGSYSDLFPNLPSEIVTDVLQRYAGESATAIRHLMMLSHCVTEAGGSEPSGPTTEVPDEASWCCDSGSSSGDEGSADVAYEGMDSVAKLKYLRDKFPTANPTEVQQVLEACEERVSAAEQVLSRFASEDATAAGEACGSGSMICAGASGTSAVTQHPSPAFEPGKAPVPSPAECAARLEQLCKCFPTVSKEFVEIALQSAEHDLAGAHKVLLDQGYSEVVEVDLPRPQPLPQQQMPTGLPVSAPASVPLPTTLTPRVPAGQSRSPPKELSKLTYERNEKIYQEERAHQNRFSEARRKCRELAWQYRQRGEYGLAEQLYQQAAHYAEQAEEEAKLASRRISKRVNAGFTEGITEDLHGKHVKEVLDMVQEQIHTLPKCFSRGVKMKYITGKGLHSANGAKIKPSLMEMLADHNIPFVEGPGYVIATFAPA